jgi:hypothetical protein
MECLKEFGPLLVIPVASLKIAIQRRHSKPSFYGGKIWGSAWRVSWKRVVNMVSSSSKLRGEQAAPACRVGEPSWKYRYRCTERPNTKRFVLQRPHGQQNVPFQPRCFYIYSTEQRGLEDKERKPLGNLYLRLWHKPQWIPKLRHSLKWKHGSELWQSLRIAATEVTVHQ